LLILIIAAGVVTYLNPQIEVLVDLHGWEVAAVVVASIVAVRLFLVPFWI
jgi:hypothetical protein